MAGHDHHHHHHHDDASAGRLTVALCLILALMVGEVVTGVAAHSLALLSDAGHMLTDAAALAMSLVALRLAARPAAGAMTYGLRRAEILSAQINGITLLLLGAIIAYTGVRRLVHPPHVAAWAVLALAGAGIVVNLAATMTLAGGGKQRSLNIEGSYQHMLTDLYAFIGTAIAAVVILVSGFERADAIASLVIAALMLRSGTGLVLAAGRVFMEAAPEGLDPKVIGPAMAAVPDVVEIHDLHVWEVTSGFVALSAHVLVADGADCHAARHAVAELLKRDFAITHTTLQTEHVPTTCSRSM